MKPNWKFGMSTGIFTEDNFKKCAEGGVDVVELSSIEEVYRNLDWKAVGNYAKSTGVGIWSIHLPFWANPKIDPACMDADVRKHTLEMFREYTGRASELGAKIAVVHPALEPTDPAERQTRIGYSQESMSKLADIAAEYGMIAAVEDLPRTCLGNTADELYEIVSCDDRLGVTFDVNHLLLDSHEHFVELLGKRIVTTHISDYDFRNERHWLPGEGMIDWPKLVTLLENCGYTGPWLYELGLNPPDSIDRRVLTYGDFRTNYEECLNKVKPTVIGTPVKEVVEKNSYLKEPIVKC